MKTNTVMRYMADTRAQLQRRRRRRPLSWYHVETCELQNVFVFYFLVHNQSYSCDDSPHVDVSDWSVDARELCVDLWVFQFLLFFFVGFNSLFFGVFLCDRNFW